MSFLSSHIAKETGQDDPVTGPKSPHAEQPHHAKPEPAKTEGRVVMHPQGYEVNEHPPAPPKRHRFFGRESA